MSPKPPLTIDLCGPDGNAHAIIANVVRAVPSKREEILHHLQHIQTHGGSYDDVRRLAETYCDVSWVNDEECFRHPRLLRTHLLAVETDLSRALHLHGVDCEPHQIRQALQSLCEDPSEQDLFILFLYWLASRPGEMQHPLLIEFLQQLHTTLDTTRKE